MLSNMLSNTIVIYFLGVALGTICGIVGTLLYQSITQM